MVIINNIDYLILRRILCKMTLMAGNILEGTVVNITNFGAFVDIGIKQNGLIHISNMADKYVSNPNEILKLHQHVTVKVLDVDLKRGRIQLKLLKQ